jgi:hypothetical protein
MAFRPFPADGGRWVHPADPFHGLDNIMLTIGMDISNGLVEGSDP